MTIDQVYSSISSLDAINKWLSIINANINNSTRVGYKSSALKFDGTGFQFLRLPQSALQPIQIPESTLVTQNTKIDFSQGAIVNSNELSNMAVTGRGFFILSDKSTVLNGEANGKMYFSRDGEFHWDSDGLLRNSQGLYVMDKTYIPNSSAGATTPPSLAPWWNTSWLWRENLTITNTDTLSLPANSMVNLHFDTAKLIADGKMRADGNDLRILYWNGAAWTEVGRNVVALNTPDTIIAFRTQAAIGARQTADNYYVYYGNPGAGAAPPDPSIGPPVFSFYDNFEGGLGLWDPSQGDASRNWTTLNAPGSGDADLEMVETFNTGSATWITAGNVAWNDYYFDVDIGNYDFDNDAVDIYLRYQDANNWYRLRVTGGGVGAPYRRIEKMQGGFLSPLLGDNFLPTG